MQEPLVSVVLPARNEERRIEQALASLCALTYPRLQILVVDDRSTDATHERAAAFIASYRGEKELRLLRSPGEPPAGWVGKTFAADYAIQQSKGEIILVCDADVTHKPESLSLLVARMYSERLDLLSQLPHFETKSITEYPLLFQTFLLYFASTLARVFGSRQSFIMGTYLLFTRDFYRRSGGWQVQRSYPESLPLLNYCVAHGGRFVFAADRGLVTARMHEGGAATFQGLVRNSNFRLLQPLPLIIFVASVALFTTALFAASQGNLIGICGVVTGVGMFGAHLVRARYPRAVVLGASVLFVTMPLYLTVVALTAATRQLLNLPVVWRGRRMRPQ